MAVDPNLINFVAEQTQANPTNIRITKLFGQASARQYFRATLSGEHMDSPLPSDPSPLLARRSHHKGGTPNPCSVIVMQLPQGFSSPAEEITKIGDDAPQELPFINIQKYLSGLDINVPKIFAADAEQGLLLLEDLGDTLFEDLVKKAEGEFFLMYYKKAIELLANVQTKTLSNSPLPDRQAGNPLLSRGGRGSSSTCIAFHRHFDADLLSWEWNHFLEYGIEDRLKIKVSESDRQVFKESTQKLTNLITKMPQGFVLRDFQSRNIMFHNFDFYLIDFQDALTGPLLYDLVALLRDSYVNIGPKEVESLLSYYTSILPKEHPYRYMTDQSGLLRKDFYLLTLHRKLKDTGRFQYIHTVKKNANFLPHVPQSLAYVKQAFDKLEEMGCGQNELKKMIGRYLCELK